MKYRPYSSLAIVTMTAAALMFQTQASGQASAASASAKSKAADPRTRDGQPDLQGIWNTSTVTPMERPRDLAKKEFFASEEEARAYEKAAFARSESGLNNGIGS